MIEVVKDNLWKQFGAAIDMLQNAIDMCPGERWNTGLKFWYIAYHTLFFLDYYLCDNARDFAPPLPFDFSEFEDVMPPRVYSKEELTEYLAFCRSKCHRSIASVTEEKLSAVWQNISRTMTYTVFELMLYNMRHVQHHAAQLNLLLRQEIDDAPDWVQRATENE